MTTSRFYVTSNPVAFHPTDSFKNDSKRKDFQKRCLVELHKASEENKKIFLYKKEAIDYVLKRAKKQMDDMYGVELPYISAVFEVDAIFDKDQKKYTIVNVISITIPNYVNAMPLSVYASKIKLEFPIHHAYNPNFKIKNSLGSSLQTVFLRLNIIEIYNPDHELTAESISNEVVNQLLSNDKLPIDCRLFLTEKEAKENVLVEYTDYNKNETLRTVAVALQVQAQVLVLENGYVKKLSVKEIEYIILPNLSSNNNNLTKSDNNTKIEKNIIIDQNSLIYDKNHFIGRFFLPQNYLFFVFSVSVLKKSQDQTPPESRLRTLPKEIRFHIFKQLCGDTKESVDQHEKANLSSQSDKKAFK